MNFSTPKIWRSRNKPVRCHSRWRKTLQKRFTLGKIIEASPKRPLMTVKYYEPKTEEDRKAIEQQNLMVMMSAVGLGPMAFMNPEKFESLLSNAR
jgi:hypothetical protein